MPTENLLCLFWFVFPNRIVFTCFYRALPPESLVSASRLSMEAPTRSNAAIRRWRSNRHTHYAARRQPNKKESFMKNSKRFPFSKLDSLPFSFSPPAPMLHHCCICRMQLRRTHCPIAPACTSAAQSSMSIRSMSLRHQGNLI